MSIHRPIHRDTLVLRTDVLPDALTVCPYIAIHKSDTLFYLSQYTLLFSLGAGPVPWLLYNEVFPTRIRARATAVCTAINYAANTVVGASFLPLVSGIGTGGTYGLYAIFCGVGYVFVNAVVFETKGLRLEDIEGVMASGTGGWEVTAGTKKAEPEAEEERK